MRFFILSTLALICQIASAETVEVKYHRAVSLDAFACEDVKEGSDVTRVCYDNAERYMVIRLKTTNYHYCEVDAATMQSLKTASSKRQFFEARIRGSGADSPSTAGGTLSRRSTGSKFDGAIGQKQKSSDGRCLIAGNAAVGSSRRKTQGSGRASRAMCAGKVLGPPG